MRFRAAITRKEAYMLGIKIGYWPCLKAPFVQWTMWQHRIDIWYGLPSYKR